MFDQTTSSPFDLIQSQLDQIKPQNLPFVDYVTMLSEFRQNHPQVRMSDIYLHADTQQVKVQVTCGSETRTLDATASKKMLRDYEIGW